MNSPKHKHGKAGIGTVWFIGAGPGDPDLITVKGQRLIAKADLVLYAGSLVPREMAACAKKTARVVDSASLCLEEIHALMRDAALSGGLVARLHTGDPLLYGAAREQMALLEADGIPCAIVPGVSAAFAAAAAAEVNLTIPGHMQSLIVTRLGGRTSVPEEQSVRAYARHGASMAVYLSSRTPEALAAELVDGGMASHVPVLLAYKVGWPDQKLVWATVATLAAAARQAGFDHQTVFLVLPGEQIQKDAPSRLYDRNFSHSFRP